MSATSNNKRNYNLWGTPGSERMIKHGLELLTTFVEDSYYTIDMEEILLQLQNFSYSNKGKYDAILALCYAEIADEDTEWEEGGGDIGYYIDSNGCKRYGVIP